MNDHGPPNNLPAQLTNFVGRDSEQAELMRLVRDARLVSVTGAAGCGKTRLALETARALLPEFADGVWMVELSRVNDAAFVGEAVAGVLRVREEPYDSIIEALAVHIGGKHALLILDGCEHLVEATASLVDRLLRTSASLQVLVTSRESLRVEGEVIWPIPSLGAEDAMELFVDRARLADPAFQLPAERASIVDQICRRLDGIPLAIELAAARVRVLSVQQLLERLEDRFRLLTGGSRAALPRHQTLRAAVDWSYQLLDQVETTLFRRLSVFTGDFAVDSLEAVCCDGQIPAGEVMDVLARLVDKSLVVPYAAAHGHHRYGLLETLAEYGRERLSESAEAELLWRRHADHFVRLAEGASESRIAEEQANLTRALEFLRATRDPDGLRLAVAMVSYWDSAGRVSEGRDRLESLLGMGTGEPDLRARAYDGAGWLAFRQADMAGARSQFEVARGLLEPLGASAELARTLSNLAIACVFSGDPVVAREHLEASLRIGRSAGATRSVAGTLWVLGLVAYFAGDLAEAQARGEESLRLAEEVEDWKLAGFLQAALGIVAHERRDYEEARARLARALELSIDTADRLNVALVLEALCRLASATSSWSLALKVGGAAAAIREQAGARSIPIWQERVVDSMAEAQRVLGPDTSSALIAQGRSVSFADAVELARGMAKEAPRRDEIPLGLTRRELEIAVMVAKGMSNKEMAEQLVLAQRTVEGHVENIRSKLGFHSRTQIAAWAVERKLVGRDQSG